MEPPIYLPPVAGENPCNAKDAATMLDLILGWAVVFLPFALAVIFIFIPARAENEKVHMRWRIGLVTFCLGFSGIAWWQQSRAARAASNDRESAIRETSARVATETTDRVTRAMAAQYQGTISSLNQEIGILRRELSGIGKSSQETTKALIKLNTTTETAVKGIPRPRRIPDNMKPELIAELSGHKGVITINRMGGGDEAMQFANDWYEILSQSGWTVTSGVNAIYSADSWVGVRVTVRGEPVAANEAFTVPGQHPASVLIRALFAVTRDVIGQRNPNLPDNATVLDIGALPRSSN